MVAAIARLCFVNVPNIKAGAAMVAVYKKFIILWG
jgi:hypothetical protein